MRGVRALLREYDLRPRKDWGQNFLVSEWALDRIVEAAELAQSDTVLEVGPGLGDLTLRLAERAGRVIAVEIDARFLAPLARVLADHPNVEIVLGDVLELDIAELVGEASFAPENYKVVANLPYYMTSAILRHLLDAKVKPRLLVVTVQREVAERVVARPGRMSLLAMSVQFYGLPRIVARIPRGAFYPPPEVDSAALRIDLRSSFPVPETEEERFFRVVRAGFSQRRKQLKNSLAHGLGVSTESVVKALRASGLDERRRAQGLSVEEWVRVYEGLKAPLC